MLMVCTSWSSSSVFQKFYFEFKSDDFLMWIIKSLVAQCILVLVFSIPVFLVSFVWVLAKRSTPLSNSSRDNRHFGFSSRSVREYKDISYSKTFPVGLLYNLHKVQEPLHYYKYLRNCWLICSDLIVLIHTCWTASKSFILPLFFFFLLGQ